MYSGKSWSTHPRCLPEAAHQSHAGERHSFTRPLAQIEWGILRSYTRRIRSIMNGNDTLDWESVGTFLNPPATEPLFPNLRYLQTGRLTEIIIKHLLYMPFPSLISLHVAAGRDCLYSLQGSLESFFKFSPNIRKLSINTPLSPGITFSNFFSSYICRWRDLQTVDCYNVALDADALAHLSRTSSLTLLHCSPSTTLPPADSPIVFPNLHHLVLSSEYLGPISQSLSQIRLPAIRDFTVFIYSYPSKQRFSSFLASVQTSFIGCTIQELRFNEQVGSKDGEEEDFRCILGFDDLQPFMAFSKLRRMYLNLRWHVVLAESELLTLASAWPRLEQLVISERCGWGTPGGVTPNGLLQLLQTCWSLSEIGLVIDTRGYTEFHELLVSLGLTLPPTFSIDVLDSFIKGESVRAIATFLAAIVPRPDFSFRAYQNMREYEDRVDHRHRWYNAYKRANDILRQRSCGYCSFESGDAQFISLEQDN
ncbi:hypothetical protein OG21DRAFT_1525453 [Imleria badia]|nr:hypothetical protein OG21DRAFT_1525453 [Imleria badia]